MSYRDLFRPHLEEITGEDPNSDGFIPIHCPFHNDKDKSAGISINTGVFNCYVCGPMSPAKFLSKYLDIPIEETDRLLQTYREENSLVQKIDTLTTRAPIYNPRLSNLVTEAQTNMTPDIPVVEEYCRARGIQYETLVQCGVGYLPANKTGWGRDSVVFPYWLDGKVVGVRYRDIGFNKSGEQGCHFTLWGLDQIDDDPDNVVIVEGETDRLVTHQALKGLMPVLSTPTAAFRREWIREFSGVRQVILVPQDDEASQKMVVSAQQIIPDKVTVLRLPWRRKQVGKDVADWLRYNAEDDLKNLVASVRVSITRRIISGRELKREAGKPRKWLIKGLLARRQVVVMAGQPKTFKTWLALNLCRTIVNPGEEFCGIPGLVKEGKPGRILFIEEEGDIEELLQRTETVLGGLSWEDYTHWGHHLGVKLDDPKWLEIITEKIRTEKIDLVVLDPFSRFYSCDENDASSMGLIWSQIAQLMTEFPELSILVIHHFHKAGSISDGWGAFRGSSRSAAEADLGIFVELRPRSEGIGIRVRFDGRSIPRMTTPDGKDIFKLAFNGGKMVLDSGQINVTGWKKLLLDLEERGTWWITDAANYYGVSTNTIRSWAEKAIDADGNHLVQYNKPGPKKPSSLSLVKGAEIE